MRSLFILIILLFSYAISFSQKTVKEHVLLLFPKGPSTEVATFDTTFLPEYDYFSYSFDIGDGEIKVLEAKIYKAKKGKKYVLIIKREEDMQCSWYNEYFYEIDQKTDSLKKMNFDNFHDTLIVSHFKDTSLLRKQILQKYNDKLKSYFEHDNLYNNFYNEYYDVAYHLDLVSGLLTSYLHICDYFTNNICAFDEEETQLLKNNRVHQLQFDKKKNRFAEVWIRIRF